MKRLSDQGRDDALAELRALDSDVGVISQYGSMESPAVRPDQIFRNAPRDHDKGALSVFAGVALPHEIVPVLMRGRRQARAGDCVRYATRSALAEAGFTVRDSPTGTNPRHVSVEVEGLWTSDVSAAFDRCFTLQTSLGDPAEFGLALADDAGSTSQGDEKGGAE